MKLRWISVIAVASALPLAGQNDQKIGAVLTLEGAWCREAKQLKANDPIHLKDEIAYCSKPSKSSDRIVIRFEGQPPYDRPYECAVPGICEPDAKLWLLGAYTRQHVTSPGGVLHSTPRTTGNNPGAGDGRREGGPGDYAGPSSGYQASELVLQDFVIKKDHMKADKDSVGSMWTEEYRRIAPAERPTASWSAAQPTRASQPARALPSIEYCELTGTKAAPCFDNWDAISHTGLYGVFVKGKTEKPVAFVGVVPNSSSATNDWLQIPAAYRKDTTPQSVEERRIYLMELIKSILQ